MPPHKFNSDSKVSPRTKGPRVKDNRRGPPGYDSRPKAKTNRRRMMGESPDCTVLTGTQRFEKKFFPPRFMDGFKDKFPPHVIEKISAAFRDVLVRISNSPASRKPHLLEKELSQAWVRPFLRRSRVSH